MARGRPKGSGNVDWASVIEQARATPGLWIAPPELTAVPERTIRVIRARERRILRMDDGLLRVRVKAHTTIGELTLCTLFIRFDKKEMAHGQSPRR